MSTHARPNVEMNSAISPALDGTGAAGLLLVLVGVFLRAMTPVSILPGWDFDPMVMPYVGGAGGMDGVGPAGSIALDAVILVGSLVLMVRSARRPSDSIKLSTWSAFALLAGALAIAWHGLGGLIDGRGVNVGDLRVGVSWLAALSGGVALMHAARDARMRALALGLCIAYVVVMAIKGAEQVFVEHPQTMTDFREHRSEFLQARGWEPDSAMARQYERRLSQNDAGGWFSLSNIYATFAAAGLTAFAGLLWTCVRTRPKELWTTAGIGACFLAACGALWLSGSKGGMMAAGAGVTALVVFGLLCAKGRTTRRLAGGFAILAVVGAIGLVIVRGIIGERIGELSLLVRWFYMQGAARMFMHEPLIGVGPDGFQQAYSLVRNPLSTEEVTSPHSILFDWTATLGVAGIALSALWLALVWRAGAAAVISSSAETATPRTNIDSTSPLWQRHPEITLTIGIVASCLVVAFRLNPGLFSLPRVLAAGNTSPEEMNIAVFALAFLGMVVLVGATWALAARVIARVIETQPAAGVAASASAVVLTVHSQIDVAASWPGSAALLMAWMGLAAGRSTAEDVRTGETFVPGNVPIRWIAPVVLGFALLVCIAAFVKVRPYEQTMAETAEAASLIAELKPLIDELTGAPSNSSATPNPPTSARQRELVTEIGDVFRQHGVQMGTGGSLSSPSDAVLAYQQAAANTAGGLADALAELASDYPLEWEVRREASRLALTAATMLRQLGRERPSRDAAALAERLVPSPKDAAATGAEWSLELHPSGEWVWAATVYENLAKLEPGREGEFLDAAEAALMKARELDPYSLPPAVRLLELARKRGAAGGVVGERAALVLELDALKRLDVEGAGLTPEERAQAESALKEP